MKVKLLKIFCVFACFCLKIKSNDAHHTPQHTKFQQQFYHPQPQHHLMNRDDGLNVDNDGNPVHQCVYPQKTQNQFHKLHSQQLAESAKDPRNLRNGIYLNGVATYDLGLPNYEILNPHDPTEIMMSNHPQYHEFLNRIKNTNYYKVEDFGLTGIAEKEAVPAATFTSRKLLIL